jgi:hypothetical protein
MGIFSSKPDRDPQDPGKHTGKLTGKAGKGPGSKNLGNKPYTKKVNAAGRGKGEPKGPKGGNAKPR